MENVLVTFFMEASFVKSFLDVLLEQMKFVKRFWAQMDSSVEILFKLKNLKNRQMMQKFKVKVVNLF